MAFKKIALPSRSVIFRLLIWHSFVLLMLFSATFTFLFIHAAGSLHGQTANELKTETDEFVSTYRSEGMEELKKAILRAGRAHGVDDMCYTVLDRNGKILFSSDMSRWGSLPVDSDLLAQAARQQQILMKTVPMPGIYPDVQVAYVQLAPDKILRAAVMPRYTDTFLEKLRTSLIITAVIVWVAVIIVGWVTLRGAIGRVAKVTKTALSVSSTSLGKRIPLTGAGDEIDNLAHAFNAMLDRIEALVNGLNEVTDNVAHDLKSPLTRIRLAAETHLRMSDADAPANEIAGQIIEESDRLLEMINTALEIKAIDVGTAALDFTEIDVADVVQQACDLFEMAAQEKNIVLHFSCGGNNVINGDLHHLQRAFANLIDNAVKYTNIGGKVDVSVESNHTNVRVTVADTGVGIAPEVLKQVFERFFRADRSRSVPGLGLGLSLAEAIVKAHGGTISVESTVDTGSTFTVVLPYRQIKKTAYTAGALKGI